MILTVEDVVATGTYDYIVIGELTTFLSHTKHSQFLKAVVYVAHHIQSGRTNTKSDLYLVDGRAHACVQARGTLP